MYKVRRVDKNQPQIVERFRFHGFSVGITSSLGNGFPDLVVAKQMRTFVVEIKDGSQPPSKQKLTIMEEEFFNTWQGEAVIVKDIADVDELNRCVMLKLFPSMC